MPRLDVPEDPDAMNDPDTQNDPVIKRIEELAEIGYKAYGDSAEWLNYQGLPMPTWEQLPDKQRRGWLAAAAAIQNAER